MDSQPMSAPGWKDVPLLAGRTLLKLGGAILVIFIEAWTFACFLLNDAPRTILNDHWRAILLLTIAYLVGRIVIAELRSYRERKARIHRILFGDKS